MLAKASYVVSALLLPYGAGRLQASTTSVPLPDRWHEPWRRKLEDASTGLLTISSDVVLHARPDERRPEIGDRRTDEVFLRPLRTFVASQT
jgi:hypothetical protein